MKKESLPRGHIPRWTLPKWHIPRGSILKWPLLKWYALIGFFLIMAAFLQRTTLAINQSHSLPDKYFLVLKNFPFKRGDFVSIKGHQPLYLAPHLSYIKEVVGLAGDRIDLKEGACYVNASYVGTMRTKSQQGQKLTPLSFQRIPPGYVFVIGRSWDSYDSRYEEFGLVRESHIQGRALPLRHLSLKSMVIGLISLRKNYPREISSGEAP